MDERPRLIPDVEGYELVTKALMDMANAYPGLEEDETIGFALEPSGEGIAIFPSAGSGIYQETESITGHVTQLCQYPFMVLYRASGLDQRRKINAKEWLDTFGRWLERQPVNINGVDYVLEKWPDLTRDRDIRGVLRQTPSYLATVDTDKSENWIMDLMIQYRNEFDR